MYIVFIVIIYFPLFKLHFMYLVNVRTASIGEYPTKVVRYKSGRQSVMMATFVDYEDCSAEVLFRLIGAFLTCGSDSLSGCLDSLDLTQRPSGRADCHLLITRGGYGRRVRRAKGDQRIARISRPSGTVRRACTDRRADSTGPNPAIPSVKPRSTGRAMPRRAARTRTSAVTARCSGQSSASSGKGMHLANTQSRLRVP